MIYESPRNVFWSVDGDGNVIRTKMVGDKDVGTHWRVLSQEIYTAEEWGDVVKAMSATDSDDGPAYPPLTAHEPEPVADQAPRAPKPLEEWKQRQGVDDNPAPRAPKPTQEKE